MAQFKVQFVHAHKPIPEKRSAIQVLLILWYRRELKPRFADGFIDTLK